MKGERGAARGSAACSARSVLVALMLGSGWWGLLSGCAEERTVHVKRGASKFGLESPVGTETVLPDGTRVVVVDELPSRVADADAQPIGSFIVPRPEYTASPYSPPALQPPPKPKPRPTEELKLREELPDGTIVLRAVMPEHVVSHFSYALKNREYAPFYAQMLSREARSSYDKAGGEAAFAEWAESNRKDLLAFITRMASGWNGALVVADRSAPMRLRYRLDRRTLPDIRFEIIEIENEAGGLRLAMVR